MANWKMRAEEPPALSAGQDTKDLGDACMLGVGGCVPCCSAGAFHQASPSQGVPEVSQILFVFFPCSSITILILLLRYLDTGNEGEGHEYSGPWKGMAPIKKNMCPVLAKFSGFNSNIPRIILHGVYILEEEDGQ